MPGASRTPPRLEGDINRYVGRSRIMRRNHRTDDARREDAGNLRSWPKAHRCKAGFWLPAQHGISAGLRLPTRSRSRECSGTNSSRPKHSLCSSPRSRGGKGSERVRSPSPPPAETAAGEAGPRSGCFSERTADPSGTTCRSKCVDTLPK
jgi:hypothetical protein